MTMSVISDTHGLLRQEVLDALAGVDLVIHDRSELDLDSATAGVSIVISGHTHAPKAFRRESVLFLSPGSVGPRRFRLPMSMARLEISEGSFAYEMIELEPTNVRRR